MIATRIRCFSVALRVVVAAAGAIAILIALCLQPPPAAEAGGTEFTLGFRPPQRDTPDDRTDPHYAASIDVLFGPSAWPVAIDAYLLASRDEYRRIVYTTGSPGSFPAEVWYVTVETGIGVRKTWPGRRIAPYVSGGLLYLTQISGQTYGTEDETYERGFGGWAGAGVLVPLTRSFHVGGSIRQSVAGLGDDSDGGGTQFGLTVGWGNLSPR